MTDARKKGFRTVPDSSQREYRQKLREHRLNLLKRILVITMVTLILAGGTALYMSLRQYTDYDIRASVERADTKATQFMEFQGNILKYSNDGASYIDHNNEMIWSQTYEMSYPTVDSCGDYLTIYDKNGKKIYILTKNGLIHNIETNYPITQVSIAGQGTVAVLMDNHSIGILALYDKKGNELVNGAIHGEKGGYPIALALSDDAIKLGVSTLDINDGTVKTTLVFYNFGTVGENAIDHIVSINSYSDIIIPELDFVSKSCMLAVADTGIMVFEGSQTPKLVTDVKFTDEAKSIFYNEKYIGVVYHKNDEIIHQFLQVYDLNGNMTMEKELDMEYINIELLSNNEICVLNERVCDIYTIHGVYKFHYEFDEELYYVIPGKSNLNYTFLLNGMTEQVRLK